MLSADVFPGGIKKSTLIHRYAVCHRARRTRRSGTPATTANFWVWAPAINWWVCGTRANVSRTNHGACSGLSWHYALHICI